MFDIGLQELVLIFVIALLVFGPKNLPQLGKSLGRAMREFRKASDEFRSTIETNLKINEIDPVPDPTPVATPPEATPEPEAKPSEPSGGRPLVADTSPKADKADKVEKRSAPVRPARAAASPAPATRKASLKKSKGGNEYDPLNPSL